MTTALLVAVDRMADGVADLNKHTKRMEGAFDDLESALDPESAAARRLLLQHSNKQVSFVVAAVVVVGGGGGSSARRPAHAGRMCVFR